MQIKDSTQRITTAAPITLFCWCLVPVQDYVGQFLATFRDFPQRQKAPASAQRPVPVPRYENSERLLLARNGHAGAFTASPL